MDRFDFKRKAISPRCPSSSHVETVHALLGSKNLSWRATPALKKLLHLFDQIHQEHADQAVALAELVRIHKQDKLKTVTEGSLKENSHG